MARLSINDFALANPLYRNASVTFYVAVSGVKTATLATLYSGQTGVATLANPQRLDSKGKFKQPVYIAQSVIGTVDGISVPSHDTGIINGRDVQFRINSSTGFVEYSNDLGVSWTSMGNPASQLFVTTSGLAASSGSSLAGFLQAGTGSVARTVQAKERERKSLQDWMTSALETCVATGTYTAQNRTDMLTAVTAAWTSALANDHDLYAPAGAYTIGDASFPWRQSGTPATLLDCNNVTLYCEGPATIFKTASIDGADVFQLNGLKNFHVKGFPTLTATVSGTVGTESGSNGVSITNGWDNITLEINALNLPSRDKTTYVDGGQALTVQPETTVNACGTLKAVVFAKGCATGFGYEPDLVTAASRTAVLDVTIIAEDCYIAVKSVAAGASGALSSGMASGFKVRGFAINCQQDVILNRMHGGSVDIVVTTTKSAAARRLNPSGVAWRATDTLVAALACTYAKNAQIKVTGEKGACDTKVSIGGTSAGSSGLNGATEYCDIYLDIAGTGATSDFAAVDSGGSSLTLSRITCTAATASAVPADFYTISKTNEIDFVGQYGKALTPANVVFPATQVSSTNVNVLDDYEEGSFTPILADTGLADEGATYSEQVGTYTKIGNSVFFTVSMTMSGLGTLTGGSAAFIIGLPFANLNTTGNVHALALYSGGGLVMGTAGDLPCAYIGPGSSYIELRKYAAAATAGMTAMTVAEVSASGNFVISGRYRAAT